MTPAPTADRCVRCGRPGHAAAACDRPFFRQFPADRRAARAAEAAARAAAREAAREERKARGPMCYTCGEYGHVEARCALRRPRCLECGLPGHLRRECPERPQVAAVRCVVVRDDAEVRSECSAAT